MDLLPGITLGQAPKAANASRWRKIRGTRGRSLALWEGMSSYSEIAPEGKHARSIFLEFRARGLELLTQESPDDPAVTQ